MSQQYAELTTCIDIDALEAWISRNTIIYDEGTDQEEHRWAPGAELAIKLLCNNLLSTGVADIACGVKKCRACQTVKPVSMFSKNLKHKDLLQSDCKDCNKAARTK
jgi:hypothetical protein